MSDRRQRLGRWGEDLAARHLQATNYHIEERNYRCSAGEMDLVATQGDAWVFVEVKAHQSDSPGRPEEAITRRKAQHLIEIAESYLQERGAENVDWRIDGIAIELDRQGKLLRLEPIENAVTGW